MPQQEHSKILITQKAVIRHIGELIHYRDWTQEGQLGDLEHPAYNAEDLGETRPASTPYNTLVKIRSKIEPH